MKRKALIICVFLISFNLFSQGLTVDKLLELRPKSISQLDQSFNSINYTFKSAHNKNDEAKQLIYEAKNKTNKESVTVHQYEGRDSFISYFFKSSKIESNLLAQIKNKNAKLVSEDITDYGNIKYVYKTKNYVFLIVKDKQISVLTIYTLKDYNLGYD